MENYDLSLAYLLRVIAYMIATYSLRGLVQAHPESARK